MNNIGKIISCKKTYWVWLIMVASFVLFAAILFFQSREIVINKPIVSEGVALVPVSQSDGIGLYDNRELMQEFLPAESGEAFYLVGIRNTRGTNAEAIVEVGISDSRGNLLAKQEKRVSGLWDDDLTPFHTKVVLLAGQKYRLSIKTKGVEDKNALSVYYEPRINSLPDVQLFSKKTNSEVVKTEVGHIGFKVLRVPSFITFWKVASHEGKCWVLLIYGLLILIAFVVVPVRVFIKKNITTELKLSGFIERFSRRELFLTGILAIVLAGIVTAPFFTRINKMDSMGDVQRNLLFRALGRESLLKEGAIAQWDPYTCGGVPLLANIESAHTDPFFLLSVFFGENAGLRLSVTLTLALGFLGAYLLARRFLGVNIASGILAGAIYSFSGFQMLAFSTGVFAWIPVGLIPLFIYFYLRSLERNIFIIPAAGMFAWIILGGGPHMPVFALLLVLFLAIGLTIGFLNWRPLLILYLILILSGFLAAVKLLPATELVVIFDSFNRAPSFIAPMSWIPKMFLDRHQDAGFSWNYALTGENYRWSEFGSYVGLIPTIIFILGLPFIVKKKAAVIWLMSGLVIFMMVFGFFPWTLLQQVPVLREIVRNPQRLRSVLVLPFGLLAAYALSTVSEKIIGNVRARKIVVGLIVLFVIIDLLSVGTPNFNNLFNLSWPKLARNEKFVRLNGGYADEDAGYYKAGYISYLANEGTTDLCVPNMSVNRPMMAVGMGTTSLEKPYRGEAYMLDTNEPAKIKYLSPTTIVVEITSLQQDDWLVLNQNFYPGWSTTPNREVVQKNGLVAARVKAGDTKIVFKYFPISFIVGLWVSLISVIVIAIFLIIKMANKNFWYSVEKQ